MKKVLIMRGVPGSGKSHHIKNLHFLNCDEVVVCSADDFFMKPVDRYVNGEPTEVMEYIFDPYKLAEAHQWCFGKFLDALNEDGDRVIIVDNTFIHLWEFKNYVKAANFAGAELQINEFQVNTIERLKLCIKRNQHRVPAEIIAKMALEFEPCTEDDVIRVNT